MGSYPLQLFNIALDQWFGVFYMFNLENIYSTEVIGRSPICEVHTRGIFSA